MPSARTIWRAALREGCIESDAVWGGGETPALEGHRLTRRRSCWRARRSGRSSPSRFASRRRARWRRDRAAGQHRRADQWPDALPRDRRSLAAGISHDDERWPIVRRRLARCVGDLRAIHRGRASSAGINLHYAAHITGHGWRKLMRLERAVRLSHDATRPAAAGLRFSANVMARSRRARCTRRSTWARGLPFMSIRTTRTRACRFAEQTGHRAWIGGTFRKRGDRKAVEIVPLGITFEGETLQVR